MKMHRIASAFLTGTVAILCLSVLVFAPLSAQVVPQPGIPNGIACAYLTSPPTLTTGQAGWVQCDNTGAVKISGSITATSALTATAAAPTYIEGTSNPFSADLSGNLRTLATVTVNTEGPVTAGAVATKSTLLGCQYLSSAQTFTNAQQGAVLCDVNGRQIVTGSIASGADAVSNTLAGLQTYSRLTFYNGTTWDRALGDTTNGLWVNVKSATGVAQGATTSGLTGSLVMGAVTTAPPTYTTAQTSPISLTTTGATRTILGNQYPETAVPYTASTTGTTGATTATLAGAASVTTYICGFSIRANATAAVTGNATVTGTITGTLNFTQWTAPTASGLGITEMIFTPCVPASATNTSIAVVSAAPGTGGVVSVTSWGYKL